MSNQSAVPCADRTFCPDALGGRLWFSQFGDLDFIDLPPFADILAMRPNGDRLTIETTRGTYELRDVSGLPGRDWTLVRLTKESEIA